MRRTSRCVCWMWSKLGSRHSRAAAAPGCCTCSSASTSCWCPPLLDRDGFHDRHAEFLLEPRAVDPEPAAARKVAHVERDDHRHAEVAQLEGQSQVELQVRRIDDADDELRRRLAGQPAEQEVARDRLVERGRREAVGAGQVEDAVLAASRRTDERSFLALDGDARVVGHLLAAAGEPVEQRRLAAVRHADQGQAHRIQCGRVCRHARLSRDRPRP